MAIIPSNPRTPRIPLAGNQCGFTLIEVLIAALVLAIGLLGMASLQAVSMQFNHGALLRTQATNLAYEITDAMRANVARAKAGDYEIDFGVTPPDSGLLLPNGQYELPDWRRRLATVLPNGQGAIAIDGDGFATVSVRWDSSRDPDSAEPVIDPDDPEAEPEPVVTLFSLRTQL